MGKREETLVPERGPEMIDERGRTPLGSAQLTKHGCHQTNLASWNASPVTSPMFK